MKSSRPTARMSPRKVSRAVSLGSVIVVALPRCWGAHWLGARTRSCCSIHKLFVQGPLFEEGIHCALECQPLRIRKPIIPHVPDHRSREQFVYGRALLVGGFVRTAQLRK